MNMESIAISSGENLNFESNKAIGIKNINNNAKEAFAPAIPSIMLLTKKTNNPVKIIFLSNLVHLYVVFIIYWGSIN